MRAGHRICRPAQQVRLMSLQFMSPLRPLAALLMLSTAADAWAQTRDSEIVVTATREQQTALEEIEPERSVDADGAASYGASTIGEVLDAIAAEMGDTGEPVLFVNGIPITDPGDIIDYPAEAIERIDVLPRGAGARLGAAPDKRAYNIVLKRSFRSLIGVGRNQFATEGGWSEWGGELFVSRIAGQQRLNLTLRARDETRLFESDRGLLQPASLFPYDLTGNLIADPRFGASEIDPLLSAAVGRFVTVAGIPGDTKNPSLASFVGTADRPNVTDIGRFRTLRPAQRTYEASLTVNQPLAPWLTAALTARIEQNTYDSLQGLRAGVFVLPVDSPQSPFSRSVGLARYFEDEPLEMRTRLVRGNLGLALSATRGKWQMSLRGDYRYNRWTYRSQRQTQSPSAPLVLDPAGGPNPFGPDIGSLLTLYADQSRSITQERALQASATGPLFELPAGPLRANLNAAWRHIDQESSTDNPFFQNRRSFGRNELSGQGSLEIPLTSREAGVLGAIGDVSLTLDYGATDVSGLGTIGRKGFAATWLPVPALRLQAAFNEQRAVPDPQQLGDAQTVTEGVRYFDVVRGETIEVTQIYGGNPNLVGERLRTQRLSATAQLLPRYSLQLNAEYLATRLRDPISSLPLASADLIAAFPDRFLRDTSGRLVTVDLRPLNFERRSSEQARWGLNFVIPFYDQPIGESGAPVRLPASRPRLQVNLSHTVNLEDEVLPRSGFPAVDLLRGGALGFGGGTPRHLFNFGANLSDREVGASLTGSWRSASRLSAGTPEMPSELRFASIFSLSLRTFANLGQLWPDDKRLKGTRVTLGLTNLLNERQRVTDQNGLTPLGYQPGFRDPLGRMIELELRKQF